IIITIMKLTPRQKKIFLTSALLFFLTLAVIISAVLVVNGNKEKTLSPVPRKNNSPSDNSGLTKTKTETVAWLGQTLSSNHVKKDDLLKKLKDEHYLNAGEES